MRSFARDDHRFQQLVFSDVAADVRRDDSGFEHQAHAPSVDAHIVADGVQIPDTFADQRADQSFRDSAQSESAQHDGGAVRNIRDSLVRGCDNFVHEWV
jgi:hypothetical protein